MMWLVGMFANCCERKTLLNGWLVGLIRTSEQGGSSKPSSSSSSTPPLHHHGTAAAATDVVAMSTSSSKADGDAKNAHLPALDGAAERLRLFKADLLDYDSVAAAVAGCDGVFHVACPVPDYALTDPEVELLAPAVTGTMNVLKACSEAKVKRVVVVSSLSAVMINPEWGECKAMDESCWSDVEVCRTTENWYCLSKTLAELEAFDYAKRAGLDVVSVCPSLVIGPLLQPTVNASSAVVVDFLKGDRLVKMKLRNFVDVRDVADAHLLVYETPEASGRYICNSHPRMVSEVIELLKSWYPTYRYATKFVQVSHEPPFSSKKLQALGWKSRPFEVTLRDSVESFRAAGVLD